MISSKTTKGILFLLMASSLVGCGDDAAVESQPAATPPGRQAPPPTNADSNEEGGRSSVTDAVSDSEWSYNPIGMRDPFRSFFVGRQEEDIRSPTPLQRYEIEQLVLQGIVWGVDRPLALVADPEGSHHMVERGTYIGRHWGKVTEITSHSIVITEEYQNDDGELLTDQQVMSLPVHENIY